MNGNRDISSLHHLLFDVYGTSKNERLRMGQEGQKIQRLDK